MRKLKMPVNKGVRMPPFRTLLLFSVFVLIAACLSSAAADGSVRVQTVAYLGDTYTIVTVQLGADADIRLYGGRSGGLTFSDALATSKGDGRQVVTLMNGGMFEQDKSPVGLFITNGEERQAINLRDGEGNFYMKPNGIFWIDTKHVAHTTVSTAFAADRSAVSLATQSGPMLLMDGVVNSELRPESTNKLVRNAVGVSADGKTVSLVISEGNVRFYDLATLFRDQLGCDDALYLDGVVSKLWTSGNLPSDPYGVVIAVTRKTSP